jgi:hypothetical protein
MTAAELLADLKRRGFRLELDDDGIAVIPFSRLTKTLHRQIRENKSELTDLLDAEAQAAQAAEAHVKPPEPVPVPVVEKAPVPKPKPREPILCDRCRLFGYPRCQECDLANDPGLVRSIEGFLLRTKPSTPIDPRYPWFRRLGYP